MALLFILLEFVDIGGKVLEACLCQFSVLLYIQGAFCGAFCKLVSLPGGT